jgi:hypothetical protein
MLLYYISSMNQSSFRLTWICYKTVEKAITQSFCLYVFYHPQDKDRPFYIGKAKYFGTKQKEGYKQSARYNGGYLHLIAGMLCSGFKLYIAEIGEDLFAHAEDYEQFLIEQWNPVQNKLRKKRNFVKFTTEKPWMFES